MLGGHAMRLPVQSIAALLSALGLAGCAILPEAGPSTDRMFTRAEPSWIFFEVKVTPRTLPFLMNSTEHTFPKEFLASTYRPTGVLRPGDVVQLSIFESGGSSLFFPPVPGTNPATTVTVPVQVIEANGDLTVPFAGPVKVAGMTPSEASTIIAKSLEKQTIKPQVVVSPVSNAANVASVGGDLNKPGPMPLTLRGERILDAIDFGGGPKYPLSEMDIRLVRAGTGSTVPLYDIIHNASQNVRIRPSDEIVAIHNPKTFTVLGASAKNAQYNFDTPTVTLAEAVARAGGSVDTIGDPAGVFVFRREPARVALGVLQNVDTPDDFITSAGRPAAPIELTDPTLMVYRVDMNTPDGYLLAQQVQIHDKDVILITNAVGTQLQKLTTVIRGFTGIFFDIGTAVIH